MKILLLGEHYSDNLGDAVISLCFRKYLEERQIEYTIVDLSGRQTSPKKNMLIDNEKKYISKINTTYIAHIFFSCRRIMQIRKQIFHSKYEYVIYVGGSIFMDYFSIVIYYLNLLFSKQNIPVYFYGCGTGSLKRKMDRFFLKRSLRRKNVRYILMRDSVNFINSYVFSGKKKAKKTSDIAMLVGDIAEGLKARDMIGLGYISLNREDDQLLEKQYVSLVTELEKRRTKWALFTNGAEVEYNNARIFYQELQKLNLTNYGTLVDRPITPNALIADISRFSKIITCRLHSVIIAYSLGIPALAFGWSKKLEDFYEDVLHKDYVISLKDETENILYKFDRLEFTDFDRSILNNKKSIISKNIDEILNDIYECEMKS